MEHYSIFREIADSWGLLAMFLAFLGVVVWALRPGSRKTHSDIANIPFRNEDRPADDPVDITKPNPRQEVRI